VKAGFLQKIKELALRRRLEDLTSTPILTVTNERFFQHLQALLQIPGAELLFGGDVHANHTIPTVYGSWKPTAVKVKSLTVSLTLLLLHLIDIIR
jgi:1-pyrroline-5-carboxylate dehydrogenase